MNEERADVFNESDEFTPQLAAELAQLEDWYEVRERRKIRRKRRTLKIRRQLEDWSDRRRLREEIDYLD